MSKALDARGYWTDAGKAEVRRLWAAGATSLQIGKELGMSKDAVLGIAHRLGVPARPSPIHKAKTDRLDISQRRLDALKLPAAGPVLPAIRSLMEMNP